ncbi:hypothetical protein EB796_007808 [Bugula neritina]|uniref:DCXR n=1 Tax=Bugula neritina TaxID=10212 RepID=A0A7J7K8J5_BUGNE|nr:hypothetical protein EB796_007808 [Bugula neritina]
MVGSSRSLAYSMSKSMIDQFTRCVALDLAPKQVRVNSVNPGIILTEMVRNIVPAEHLDAFMRETYKIYPLGKVAEAVDVAKMIAFLASSECSFTTGTRNTVDSGFHVACPR